MSRAGSVVILAGVALCGMSSAVVQAQILPPLVPAGNPITLDKALLGKALFWDEQLSSTKTVSCGTCHFPTSGGSDPRSIVGDPRSLNPGPDAMFGTADDVVASPGVPRNQADGAYLSDPAFGVAEQVTGRKAPSPINAAYAENLFLDGRAGTQFHDPVTGALLLTSYAALESQAVGPVMSDVEMAHIGRTWADFVTSITSSRPLALSSFVPTELANWIGGDNYPQLFNKAFGTPEVTPARFAMAVATYERTLLSNDSKFDRYLQGTATLTPAEDSGYVIFSSPLISCNECHREYDTINNLFTDNDFHFIGVRPADADLGRFNVTGYPEDRGAFKTPTIRDTELRAPYFRDGSAATLEEVVEFYDRGGDFDAPNKSPFIRPLSLTAQEKSDLVAFMKTLTDPRVKNGLPPFDRPSQYAESTLVPDHYGAGTPGSGGVTPRLVAYEPSVLGNTNVTLAIDSAPGGAMSLAVFSTTPDLAGSVKIHGATSYVSFPALMLLVPLQGAGPGLGWQSLSYPVQNPLLVGNTFCMQWFVRDSGAAGGVSATDAINIDIF